MQYRSALELCPIIAVGSSYLIGTTGKGWAAWRSLSKCPSVSGPTSAVRGEETNKQASAPQPQRL